MTLSIAFSVTAETASRTGCAFEVRNFSILSQRTGHDASLSLKVVTQAVHTLALRTVEGVRSTDSAGRTARLAKESSSITVLASRTVLDAEILIHLFVVIGAALSLAFGALRYFRTVAESTAHSAGLTDVANCVGVGFIGTDEYAGAGGVVVEEIGLTAIVLRAVGGSALAANAVGVAGLASIGIGGIFVLSERTGG